MGPTALSIELPSDEFEVVQGRRGVLARHRDEREALDAVGFGPDGGECLEPTDLTGRRRLEGFVGDGRRYAVRRFRHGGLLRALTGERFADPRRPFHELVLAATLDAAGIGTPRIAAARAIRARPWGWRLALVTRREEGTIDLAAALERVRAGDGGDPVRRALVTTVGDLVGRLHRAGFVHADLHPKNILVGESAWDGAPVRLWVLDLDRSTVHRPLPDEVRLDNLRRLHRSVRRADGRGRPWLGPGDRRRFLVGYAAGLGREEGEWRSDWRAIAHREATRTVWHRLGWFLEGLVRGR